jgi:hypothetical protein
LIVIPPDTVLRVTDTPPPFTAPEMCSPTIEPEEPPFTVRSKSHEIPP